MDKLASERRMIENEAVFRRYNERVQRGFDKMRKTAREDNQEHLITEDDIPLYFYCECYDEACRERIELKPSRYNKIHQQRDQFVVICGHEARSIEQIIGREAEFCIIKKFMIPPESVTHLQPTDFDGA